MMFIFTLCWAPFLISMSLTQAHYLFGGEENDLQSCMELQLDNVSVSCQNSTEGSEMMHKQRLFLFPCIHSLITTNTTECVLYHNYADAYNRYFVCVDILHYIYKYVTMNFMWILSSIAALNSVFNPLIYAFMSKDFKHQVERPGQKQDFDQVLHEVLALFKMQNLNDPGLQHHIDLGHRIPNHGHRT